MVKTSSEDDVDDHAPGENMSEKEVAAIIDSFRVMKSMEDDAEEVVSSKLETRPDWVIERLDEYHAYHAQDEQVCGVCRRTDADSDWSGFDEVAQVCWDCQDEEDHAWERQGRSEMLESQVLGRDTHAGELDGKEEEHLQDNEEFRTKEDQELAKKEREYAEDSASKSNCGKCGAVVSFGQSLGTHMAYICDACGNEERDSDGLPEYSDD